jgi:conjugative transposon TraM protein
MEQKTISLKELKKRKFLLVLPILTLPFITVLFWSFSGGQRTKAVSDQESKKGFNSVLPIPKFKEDASLDKLSYYDQASLDSTKRLEQIKKDPYYSQIAFQDSVEALEAEGFSARFRKGKMALRTGDYKDLNQEKLYQKLGALQKAINQPIIPMDKDQDMREFQNYGSLDQQSSEVKNLEQLMTNISAAQQPDPELKELGSMLENIIDIQHPQRVQQKLKESTEKRKGKVFAVEKKVKENTVSSLQGDQIDQNATAKMRPLSNSFYALDEEQVPDEQQNAIAAVVHQTQTIVSGSTVKLRLSDDVFIEGVQIPKNSFLYGIAALKGERLEVKINHIAYMNSIFPVTLSLYDKDAIEGIYIPGALNRDVAKASAERSIGTFGMTGLDDSWGAQAAGMGIQAAKGLMSKKVKLIKVVVKAGYQVLLYDEHQKKNP